MKLIETKTNIVETKNVSGLMDCIIKHEIKNTSATAKYTGPKIPFEEWQAVLAFMKWVYDEHKSECQVRMYVNPEAKTWKAWAYPQEARTGMSAKELDTEDTKKQREQFKDSEGWIYFGTIHSHCSCSAFQSGTDEANERNQDGLHITIGKLDEKHYDLHARFYRSGLKFEPDMSHFWDIGEPWADAPDEFVNKNLIARWEMCEPEDGIAFPDQWKLNVIEVKTEVRGLGYWSRGDGPHGTDYEGYHSPYLHGPMSGSSPNPTQQVNHNPAPQAGPDHKKGKKGKKDKKEEKMEYERLEDACKEIEACCKITNITEEELTQSVAWLEGDDAAHIIYRAGKRHDVDLPDLIRELMYSPSLTAQDSESQLGLTGNAQ